MIWSSPYRNGPKSRQHSMMRMPHFFHVWKTQRIAPADPTCGSAASLKQSMTSNRSPLPCFRNSHPLYLSNIWNSIEFTGHSVSRQTDGPPPDIIIKLHFFRTREQLLTAARNKDSLLFQSHAYQLFSDLAPLTIAKHCAMKPQLQILIQHQLKYT